MSERAETNSKPQHAQKQPPISQDFEYTPEHEASSAPLPHVLTPPFSPDPASSLLSLVGNHAAEHLLQRKANKLRPNTITGLQNTIGNQALQRLLAQSSSDPQIQRVTFGSDGSLPSSDRAVVSQAARIAEELVMGTEFSQKWQRFWQGPGSRITPKPTLEQYQTAVRQRIIHNMDTSTNSEIQQLVMDERGMPTERQTAGVTLINTRNTYLRRFAIGQGLDTIVSLILHESLHGAGLPMGPLEMFEPLFHQFEAEAGFPLMMGGADIGTIRQQRVGDYHITADIEYNLRLVDRDVPLPDGLEIQVVWQSSGEVAHDEQPDGTRVPARHPIPSRPGPGRWRWNGRYPGWQEYSVRIVSTSDFTLLGSKTFESNPHCILGVSSRHCDDE